MIEAQICRANTAVLVQLLEEAGIQLFHTPDGQVYADLFIGDRRQTYPIGGEDLSDWMNYTFYKVYDHLPKAEAVKEVLRLLEIKAKIEGSEFKVNLRLAEHEGRIYLDLGGSDWAAVEISPQGWQVVPSPPVRFRRSKGLQPLPQPEKGGQVKDLLQVVNINEEDWVLVAAWLVAALKPKGPYPLLVLHGEQGSGKSSLARLLKELIDPTKGVLRSQPRNERDLMIAAQNSWVLPFDNLSTISTQLSDALCRLSTGGSFGTRKLFTDDGETILEAARPVIITSIEEVIAREDLLDRSICVHLPIIPDGKRRPEREMLALYEQLKPRLLGALLDAVSAALQKQAEVQLEQLPRMADFAVWAVAAESGLALEPGAFMKAYTANRFAAHEVVIEKSPVALAIKALLDEKPIWEGEATDLLAAFCSYADKQAFQDNLPKAPNKLSNVLDRLTPCLRAIGIQVTRSRRGQKGTKIIRLEVVKQQ